MAKISDSEKARVQRMYDSDESPLFYQIKPSGTFDIIESRKITKKDFKNN